ncbi:MAG: FAD-binding protein [Nitriliruptorales bacterium]
MRSYNQYCPVARASEILAERWTPIILRNLLLGCRTFNEIAAGAPGLSRALLTRRLRELERVGIIETRPKPEGRGSLYEPTRAGRDLWPVLSALADWAEQWADVAIEHAEPGAVLWAWCEVFLRHDLLPDGRVVVRFEFRDLNRDGRWVKAWLLIERSEGELCEVDPGFGDDAVVVVEDPLMFARWHLGLVDWSDALRAGAIRVSGPRGLLRALPTWNTGPEIHARLRAEQERTAGSPPLPPLGAVDRRDSRLLSQRMRRTRVDVSLIPGFEGDVVTPGDLDYDEARAVWNGAVDRRPRYVARCLSAADVAAVLRFGRERDLPISVRGGGHGAAGNAVCDDGLVVDLAPMKTITVDPAQARATVQAGVVWGELDTATQAFGLATTGGTVSRTGVAGLTLGGGIGWLMRRHGLTDDNLLGAEVVLADGQHLTVSERNHPDLFWGLRGGGGGLGVVTTFTFRLHPIGPEVLAGMVIWGLEDAPEVLGAYREFVASASEVSTVVALRRAPPAPYLPVELHRRPVCVVAMLALGPPGRAERLLAPMRTFGRPLLDLVKRRPYTNLQSMFDGGVPPGWHYYWKTAGLRRLDDDVIDKIVDHTDRSQSPWSYAVLFHLGGAVAEIDPEATAYSHRDVAHELNVNAVWKPQETIADGETAWARDFIAALQPHHAGVYLNFLDHDDQHRVAEAFTTSAHRRLIELQQRFDPDQVFSPYRQTASRASRA